MAKKQTREKVDEQSGYEFRDVVKTDDWSMLDGEERLLILAPFFCSDNKIAWGLNVRGE